MTKEQITAKTSTGKTIPIDVSYENGLVCSEYPITQTERGFAVSLNREQVKSLLDIELPKKAKIALLVIVEQEKYKNFLKKVEKEQEKEEQVKAKTEMEFAAKKGLHLQKVYTSYGASIAGLPRKLAKYENILLNFLEWDFDPYDGEYGKSCKNISLEDLLKEIEKIENKIKNAKTETKNKENQKIKEAKIEAEKSGKNITVKHEVIDWDSKDEGDVVCKDTYITPEGTIKTFTYHTY